MTKRRVLCAKKASREVHSAKDVHLRYIRLTASYIVLRTVILCFA